MEGYVYGIVAVIAWTACTVPFAEASKRLGVATVNLYRLLIPFVLFTIVLSLFLFPNQNWISDVGSIYWVYLIASGVIGLAIGDMFGFSVYSLIGPRLGSLFIVLQPAIALIAGYFLLHETINWIGIISIIITITGVAYVLLSKNTTSDKVTYTPVALKKGIIFGILSTVCQAMGIVLQKLASQQAAIAHLPEIHFLTATWIRITGAIVFLLILYTFQKKHKEVHTNLWINADKGVSFLIVAIVFGPLIAQPTSFLATSILPVSVFQTLCALIPILVLPITAIYYKEKITWKIILGSLISCFGVVILIWRDTLL